MKRLIFLFPLLICPIIHGNNSELPKGLTDFEKLDLDQIYDTEHFRFYYTLDESSIHVVENQGYVITMSEVFENVWDFFMDTLEFEQPLLNPENDHSLYEIYIEYLSPQYFALTYGQGFGASCHGFIKMRQVLGGIKDVYMLQDIQQEDILQEC